MKQLIITNKAQNKLKLLFIISISLLTLNSCKNRDKKITTDGITYTNYNIKEKDTIYLDTKGNKHKNLGNVPDSLRTPEQQKLINAINDVLLNGVVVENNKMVLKFTKEQCLTKGLTEHYYEALQNNIRTNNSYFEAYGIKDVAGMKASTDSVITGLKR